jgi:hypothetical protein
MRAKWCAAVLLGAATLGACQADSPAGPASRGPAGGASRTTASATVPDTLFSELSPSNVIVTFVLNQNEIIAKDFQVPQGETWHVSSIVLRGFIGERNNPTFTLPWTFRNNASGQPGSVIQSFILNGARTPAVDVLNDYRYDLPTSMTFGPGTYWLQIPCAVDQAICMAPPIRGLRSAVSLNAGSTWVPFGFDDDVAFGLIGTRETAPSTIKGLEDEVSNLGLDHGTVTSLQAKLEATLASLASGDLAAACSGLQDFINLVTAQSGKKLTVDQATALINEATRVRTLLGC